MLNIDCTYCGDSGPIDDPILERDIESGSVPVGALIEHSCGTRFEVVPDGLRQLSHDAQARPIGDGTYWEVKP